VHGSCDQASGRGLCPVCVAGHRRVDSDCPVQVELSQEALIPGVLRGRSQADRPELDGAPVQHSGRSGVPPGPSRPDSPVPGALDEAPPLMSGEPGHGTGAVVLASRGGRSYLNDQLLWAGVRVAASF
jgi:hypothetical protein